MEVLFDTPDCRSIAAALHEKCAPGGRIAREVLTVRICHSGRIVPWSVHVVVDSLSDLLMPSNDCGFVTALLRDRRPRCKI